MSIISSFQFTLVIISSTINTINTITSSHLISSPIIPAPEVLRGVGHGTAVDMWSLGTLTYEMLTGLVGDVGEKREDMVCG